MTDEVVGGKRLNPNLLWQADSLQSQFGMRNLIALLIAEVLVLALARLPLSLSWDNFAFMDQGANLAVQTLLDQGFSADR